MLVVEHNVWRFIIYCCTTTNSHCAREDHEPPTTSHMWVSSQFVWPGWIDAALGSMHAALASGASKTFNYSTDTNVSFDAKASTVVHDSVCAP
jgi:hypothetical protein